jgi:hypothetical protein
MTTWADIVDAIPELATLPAARTASLARVPGDGAGRRLAARPPGHADRDGRGVLRVHGIHATEGRRTTPGYGVARPVPVHRGNAPVLADRRESRHPRHGHRPPGRPVDRVVPPPRPRRRAILAPALAIAGSSGGAQAKSLRRGATARVPQRPGRGWVAPAERSKRGRVSVSGRVFWGGSGCTSPQRQGSPRNVSCADPAGRPRRRTHGTNGVAGVRFLGS